MRYQPRFIQSDLPPKTLTLTLTLGQVGTSDGIIRTVSNHQVIVRLSLTHPPIDAAEIVGRSHMVSFCVFLRHRNRPRPE
jgi:hypothetical protein